MEEDMPTFVDEGPDLDDERTLSKTTGAVCLIVTVADSDAALEWIVKNQGRLRATCKNITFTTRDVDWRPEHECDEHSDEPCPPLVKAVWARIDANMKFDDDA